MKTKMLFGTFLAFSVPVICVCMISVPAWPNAWYDDHDFASKGVASCNGTDPNNSASVALGADWVQATSAAAWPARKGHTSVAYDGKI
jgi:hypothetical protein